MKSKIEEICSYFEQSDPVEDSFSLSNVHPMNIASVIKLYLRRLPEVSTVPFGSHQLNAQLFSLS